MQEGTDSASRLGRVRSAGLNTLMPSARALLTRSRTHPPCTPRCTVYRRPLRVCDRARWHQCARRASGRSHLRAKRTAGRRPAARGRGGGGRCVQMSTPSGATRKLSPPADDSLAAVSSLSRSSGAVDEALTALAAAGLVRASGSRRAARGSRRRAASTAAPSRELGTEGRVRWGKGYNYLIFCSSFDAEEELAGMQPGRSGDQQVD